MSTLIVAPWGNPLQWNPVTYTVEVPSNRATTPLKVSRRYKATLGALQEALKDVQALILASSTLMVEEQVAGASYTCVREAAERFVRRFLTGEYLHDPHGVELAVLPGIGRFTSRSTGCVLEAVGTPLLYMLCAFREVAKRLLERKPSRLVLDLSHGVNYMPVMAYRAVEAAAHYYSIRTGEELELLVYNSDPVLPGVEEAAVHLVERRRVEPDQALERAYAAIQRLSVEELAQQLVRVPPRLAQRAELGMAAGKLRNKLKSELKKVEEPVARARGIVKGARKGLPLYVAYKIFELRSIEVPDPLELLGGLEEHAIVEVKEGSVSVVHLVNPSGEILNLPLALALARKLQEEAQSQPISYTLGYLRELTERYVIDEHARSIVLNELGDIEERVAAFVMALRKLGLEAPRNPPYRLIYDVCEARAGGERLIQAYRGGRGIQFEAWIERNASEIKPQLAKLLEEHEAFACKPEHVDRRNFYAHAGMERNTVQVDLESRSLSYYPGCLQVVEQYASDP